MGIAEIFGAIFGGGATGLLGAAITSVMDYFKLKQKNQHEVDMAEIETRHLEMEIDRDVIVSKQEANAKMEVAAAKTQAASYQTDTRTYLSDEAAKGDKFIGWMMAIVDFVRGITRPGLTTYLVIVTTLIYFSVREIVDEAGLDMTGDQAFDLMKLIIVGFLYLTFTAVGWWFGSRSKVDQLFKL